MKRSFECARFKYPIDTAPQLGHRHFGIPEHSRLAHWLLLDELDVEPCVAGDRREQTITVAWLRRHHDGEHCRNSMFATDHVVPSRNGGVGGRCQRWRFSGCALRSQSDQSTSMELVASGHAAVSGRTASLLSSEDLPTVMPGRSAVHPTTFSRTPASLPRTMRTSCRAPLSCNGIAAGSTATPSSSAVAMPRDQCRGFEMTKW